MDIGDIIFRGALVSAVIVLAGVFAYNIGPSSDDDVGRAEKIADSLSTILYSMTTWSDGSGSILRFGGDMKSSTSLPGDINDEAYSIKVLPGSVLLEFRGSYYPAMEDISVIPSRPPRGPGILNSTVARDISRTFGGYTIRTPCTLRVYLLEQRTGVSMFIWPDDSIKGSHMAQMDSLETLCMERGEVIDGWEQQVRFPADDIKVRRNFILFLDGELPGVQGSTGTPFLLPWNTDLSSVIDQDPDNYVLRRYSKVQEDGTFLIITSLHTA